MGDETEFKIHIVSDADNTGFKSAGGAAQDLSKEMGVVNVSQDDANRITKELSDSTEATGKSFERMTVHGREFHHVIGEINRAIPGMGFALQGLVTSAGPWIVAILAIQEAMNLWNIQQEAAKEKAAKLGEELDTTRTAAHNLLEQLDKFNTLMSGSKGVTPEYLKNLADTNTLLNAQFEVKKKILELTNPAGEAALAGQKEAAEINATANARIALENQQASIARQIQDIRDSVSALISRRQKNVPVQVGLGSDADEINHLAGNVTQADIDKASADAVKKISDLNKTLEELNKQSAELKEKYKVQTGVADIQSGGQAIIDVLNSHGGKTNQTLAQVASAIGLTEQQKLNIVERILNHQLTIQAVWKGLDARLAAAERQLGAHATTGNQ